MEQVESIILPQYLVAGDSLSALTYAAQFLPSAGWSARLVIVGGANRQTVDGVDEDDSFRFTVASTTTSGWVPGKFSVYVAFSKGAERYTMAGGSFDVQPDPLAASITNFDTRSTAQKIVEAIDAWMTNKSGWAGEKQIGDRRVKDHPLPELLTVRSHYATLLASEQAAANLAAGIVSSRGRVNVSM